MHYPEIIFEKGKTRRTPEVEINEKGATACANLYGVGYLGMDETIYSRDGRILAVTACPTRGH